MAEERSDLPPVVRVAHCANCDLDRDVDNRGRCATCGSESVVPAVVALTTEDLSRELYLEWALRACWRQ